MTIQDEYILKITKELIKINNETEFCAFAYYSGHVQFSRFTFYISQSKEQYNARIFKAYISTDTELEKLEELLSAIKNIREGEKK